MKKAVFAIHPLSHEEWEAIAAIWQPVIYNRKTVLTAAGKTEHRLYFVPEATVVFLLYVEGCIGKTDRMDDLYRRRKIQEPVEKKPACAATDPA